MNRKQWRFYHVQDHQCRSRRPRSDHLGRHGASAAFASGDYYPGVSETPIVKAQAQADTGAKVGARLAGIEGGDGAYYKGVAMAASTPWQPARSRRATLSSRSSTRATITRASASSNRAEAGPGPQRTWPLTPSKQVPGMTRAFASAPGSLLPAPSKAHLNPT